MPGTAFNLELRMVKTIAERLFDQTAAFAEDELIHAIWDICGDDNFSDWTWDWYDSRFEFIGCHKDWRLPKKALEFMYEQGFATIWLQHEDNMETHYSSVAGGKETRNKLAPHRIQTNKQAAERGPKIVELIKENKRLKKILHDIG